MKIPILILYMLFLFATASMPFCVKAGQQDDFTFVEDEVSSSSKDNNGDDNHDTLNDVEIIAYLNINVYTFSTTAQARFITDYGIYLSPVNIYNSPPPKYV